MDKCNTCAYYQPRVFYCEYYLKGKETAVYLCPYCRIKNEEMQEVANKDAFYGFQQLRNDIDSDNWLFVGTINPQMVDMAIDALAQPERKKGKWIKAKNWGIRCYQCDQCGNYLDFDGVNAGRGDANYCPNCGADMRGEQG